MENETLSQAAPVTVVDSKRVILTAALTGLRTMPGFGVTIVEGRAQPILKIITPSGEAFSVTVK